MTKRLILTPSGWPCTYEECPPGFFVFGESVGFKSEYRGSTGKIDGYNEAGEFYCGPVDGIVQPVDPIWIEEEL